MQVCFSAGTQRPLTRAAMTRAGSRSAQKSAMSLDNKERRRQYMKNNNEKRMAGCWEVLHALRIGDKEVVAGENLTKPNETRYMCA